METLRDLFEHVVSAYGGRRELLRAKRGGKWIALSTDEFGSRVRNLAAGLQQAGVEPGDRLAIFSENRPEWHVFDFACHLVGAVSVPLYPNLTPEQVAYIVRDSGARMLFVSTAELFRTASDGIAQLGGAVGMVVFDELSEVPAGVVPVGDLEERGAAELKRVRKGEDPFHRPRGEDVASLIYTSGTTGDPKGVMLSHWNFVFDETNAMQLFDLGPKDVVLSFLPLSHVFERTVDYALLHRGVQICYVEAIERVPARLVEVRPTILVSVPRLFERSYIKIVSNLKQAEGVKRRLVDWALKVARRHAEAVWAGDSPSPALRAQYVLARRQVFSKILAKLGGKIRFAISGGAPLSREVAEFFAMIGLPIFQGYGLTETSPVIAVNSPGGGDRIGSVGRAIPGVEVRIAEDGEILTRGAHLMQGYFNREAETAEVMDDEGWLHTGDVGYLDADGFLFITDRKKDIIVTSGGKNVAPQPIEGRLQATPYIAQAVVIGDRYPYLTALLVPNFENLGAYYQEKGERVTPQEIAEREETRRLLDETVRSLNRELAQHEKIRKFTVLAREFSLAEGEITPTLKVRRRVVAERYRDVIEGMYLKTQLADQYHAE